MFQTHCRSVGKGVPHVLRVSCLGESVGLRRVRVVLRRTRELRRRKVGLTVEIGVFRCGLLVVFVEWGECPMEI